MKILITGSNGFIGGKIEKYFVEKEYFVIGCGRKKRAESINEYFTCDLSKEIPNIYADIVIHAAAMSPTEGANFNDYFNNNVIATRNLIEYAKRNSVKRIIYLGAVSSYGHVDEVLQEESPHNNPDMYGLTKYIAEQLVNASGIPHYVLILPGVVGEGCNNNWIMNAARTLYKGEKFTYYNGKGMFNNILDINDLCIFIEKLLEKEFIESDTFLLGSSEMMRVEDVILFLYKQLSSKSSLIESNVKNNSFCLDINKAQKAGFESSNLKDILISVCRRVIK